jgi:hypothetical protein
MSLISKAAVLVMQDLPYEDVSVPEWGGEARVSVMSGTARDAFEDAVSKARAAGEKPNFRARLAAASVVDEQGEPVFTEADIEALGKKSATALDRICKVAMRLNGMGAEGMKEIEGNTAGDRSASSTSGSPSA